MTIFIVLCLFVIFAGITLVLVDRLLIDNERPVDDDFPDDYWDDLITRESKGSEFPGESSGPIKFEGHWFLDDAPDDYKQDGWRSIHEPNIPGR